MKRILFALLCVLALAGWGKSTVGAEFNGANLVQLQVGQSTLADAVQLLGRQPDNSQAGKSGAIGHTWLYTTGEASFWTGKVKSSVKSVTLVFSTDGTFQRIYKLQGIELPPQDRDRLMAMPAAAVADAP